MLVAVCRGWSVWRRLWRTRTNGINTDTCESGVEWQVGWFIVFPLTATSRCSLLVGKIEEDVRAEEGENEQVGKQIDVTGCQGLTERPSPKVPSRAKCLAQRFFQIPKGQRSQR